MNDRIKFQVLNSRGRWRTAYCKPQLLAKNIRAFLGYGFTVRLEDEFVHGQEKAA